MAERKVIDCDGCTKKALQQYGTIRVPIAHHTRVVAEDDEHDWTIELQLCVSCLAGIIQNVVSEETLDPNYHYRRDWRKGREWMEKYLPAYDLDQHNWMK